MNILFTCIGRRVSLLNSFKKSAKQLGINAKFFGTDTTELSPAIQLCDKKLIVNPISHSAYIKQLLDITKKHKIDLIVPTIDTDLLKLAKSKSRFAKLGCLVLISKPSVIEICQDKRKTFKFLSKNKLDCPKTTLIIPKSTNTIKFPILLKPWDGSASKGIALVNNRQELRIFAKKVKNCIAQEYIAGTEYTCDVFVDCEMKVRCVVPRKRIEVRAGEVSKGVTIKNSQMMEQVQKIIECLGAGPGVITVQLILTKDKKLKCIEINPRFGGGAPLGIKAGANYPKWILQELMDKKPRIKFDNFEDGLIMLRYDSEVFLFN